MAIDLNNGFAQLLWHVGHTIRVVTYGPAGSDGTNPDNVHNVAIECDTCGDVLLDFYHPNTESTDEDVSYDAAREDGMITWANIPIDADAAMAAADSDSEHRDGFEPSGCSLNAREAADEDVEWEEHKERVLNGSALIAQGEWPAMPTMQEPHRLLDADPEYRAPLSIDLSKQKIGRMETPEWHEPENGTFTMRVADALFYELDPPNYPYSQRMIDYINSLSPEERQAIAESEAKLKGGPDLCPVCGAPQLGVHYHEADNDEVQDLPED